MVPGEKKKKMIGVCPYIFEKWMITDQWFKKKKKSKTSYWTCSHVQSSIWQCGKQKTESKKDFVRYMFRIVQN